MVDCIDVEARFPIFKLGYEDPAFEGTQDPWHKVIVCRHGTISPAGGDKLWACTKGPRNEFARAVRRGELPCVIKMDGDDGINAEFSVDDAKQVFKAMGAKRR